MQLPDSFAFFLNGQCHFQKGRKIELFPVVKDCTHQISLQCGDTITLCAGTYLISYQVSAFYPKPDEMKVTPYYNGASHPETGVCFVTGTKDSTACGSAHLILEAEESTTFSLYYHGSCEVFDGHVTLTIVKLHACTKTCK